MSCFAEDADGEYEMKDDPLSAVPPHLKGDRASSTVPFSLDESSLFARASSRYSFSSPVAFFSANFPKLCVIG